MIGKMLYRRFSSIASRNYPYRFHHSTPEKWIKYLDENGFVVVNAITEKEADEGFDHLLDTMCYLSDNKLKKSDLKTFGDPNNLPYMWKQSIVQYVAHTKWQWDLREKSAHVFAKLWNTSVNDLASSFDGFCYFNKYLKYETNDPTSWLHTDQAPSKDTKWCIQGVLNLLPNFEEDGGLVVVPKSHLYHAKFFKEIGKTDLTHNYYTLTQEEKNTPLFKNHVKVCAGKGDLLLFDSRTFHCNVPPQHGHSRSCAYICQMPKNTVSEETRKQRKIAIQDNRTSTHHPGADFEVFPYIPYEADQSLIPKIKALSIKIEDLTPLQKSLACYSDFSEEFRYKKIGEPLSEEEKKMLIIRYRQF